MAVVAAVRWVVCSVWLLPSVGVGAGVCGQMHCTLVAAAAAASSGSCSSLQDAQH